MTAFAVLSVVLSLEESSLGQGAGLAPSPWAGEHACGRVDHSIGDAHLAGSRGDPVDLPERISVDLHTECAAIEIALRLEVGRRVTLASGRVLEARRGGRGVDEVFTLDGGPVSVAELQEYARKAATE
jgi:hypothetical protein